MGSATSKKLNMKQISLVNSKIVDQASFNSFPPHLIEGNELDCQPHKSIGALFMGKYGQGRGTGILISKDLVLTVAHNIYSLEKQEEYSNVQFFLAPRTIDLRKGGMNVQQCRFPQQYKSISAKSAITYDYALLKLSYLQSSPTFEYLPLTVACEDCKNGITAESSIQLFGYPVKLLNIINYKSKDNNPNILQVSQLGYKSKDPEMLYSPKDNKITHTINTQFGQSGSLIACDGKFVGLHKGAQLSDNPQISDFKCNIGRLITLDMLLNLIEWSKEMKSDSFKFQICEHVKAKINFPITNEEYQKHELIINPLSQAIILASKTISQINLFPCQKLTKLNLSKNLLKNINIASNKLLQQIYLSQNQLQEISLKNNSLLQIVKMDRNNLKLLDVSRCPQLKILHASSNCLDKINLAKNMALIELLVDNNELLQLVFFYNSNTLWNYNIGSQRSPKVQVQLLYNRIDLDKIKSLKEEISVKYWDEDNCTYIVKALMI